MAIEVSAIKRNGLAFGVDSRRRHTFSLRQARYFEIASTVRSYFDTRFAQHETGTPFKLLDIGVQDGVTRKYLELGFADGVIEYHGADLKLNNQLYRADEWTMYFGDFQGGYPQIPDDMFDVVICEQVIEHLPSYQRAMSTLSRVLKPGGLAIVGVPIFPDGLHLIRRHVVPFLDRVLDRKKERGHVQAFSMRHFRDELEKYSDLTVQCSRGFRVASGGMLRPLENQEWFWRANRFIGRQVPGLCIEIQVVATK